MRIVPSFGELKDVTASFVLSAKSSSIYQFTFERGEETFTHRIAIAITNRSCRRSHAGLSTSLSEGDRGVLSSLIRMMNNSSRPSLRDGHIKSLEHEFRTKVCLHRPADYAAAENIDHHRQMTALALVHTLEPVTRFATSCKVTAFVGPKLREESSDEKVRWLGISKAGSRLLRFLLMDAAGVAIKYDQELKRFYYRLLHHRGWRNRP
jgi:transposase IS116/IS110/IS902 family protein